MSMDGLTWVEVHRVYLKSVAERQVGALLATRIDLSAMVQKTLQECWLLPAPEQPHEAQNLLRTALLNNVLDAIRYWKAAKRDYRREVPTGQVGVEAIQEFVSSPSTPSRIACRNERETRLVGALAELPEDQRNAVMLHHLMEMPVQDVAGEMNRSVASVAGLLRRGLAELRLRLGDD